MFVLPQPSLAVGAHPLLGRADSVVASQS